MVQTSDLYSKSEDKPASPPLAKRWRQRWINLIPLCLLLAFLLLLALLFGERFIPARSVQLESVVTQRSSAHTPPATTATADANENLSFEGKALFQASGWIESDPLPFHVPALNDGFIDSVHVLEGETVVKGQLLAKLVDEDARLDLASAQAIHHQRSASLQEQQSMVRATRAGLDRLVKNLEIEAARLEELRDDATRLNAVGSKGVSEQEIAQARLRVLTQQAVIQALEANQGELEAELSARSAAVERARYALEAASVDLQRKQLAVDRMTIHSPVNGIVQKLYVSPGYKRMARMDDPESSTIAKIFDPDSLQARIDVPLEEAAQIHVGQAVRLRSVYLQDQIFQGRVTRIYGQADLQRNTLQAKVELLGASKGLRPEMLCRAEFLSANSASSQVASSEAASARAAVFVPSSALQSTPDGTYVWTLDVSGQRILQRSVRVSADARDGYQLVLEGLKPGERVVVNPPDDLKAGERVQHSIKP